MVSCSVFLPKSCKGRRDTFKGRLLPNVAFWTRWPKYGAGRPASCKRRRKTGMQPTKKGAGGPGCCPPKACKEILLLLARAPLAVAWGRRITYHTHHTIYIVIHYTTPAPHTLHHTPQDCTRLRSLRSSPRWTAPHCPASLKPGYAWDCWATLVYLGCHVEYVGILMIYIYDMYILYMYCIRIIYISQMYPVISTKISCNDLSPIKLAPSWFQIKG